MREIKFRGKRTDTKEFVYGHYVIFLEGIRKNHCIIETDNGEQTKYYVELNSIGQFTGRTDINGKEIYEGDIVYLAGYGEYKAVFPFIELYEASYENDIGGIINNIHENKDLITT